MPWGPSLRQLASIGKSSNDHRGHDEDVEFADILQAFCLVLLECSYKARCRIAEDGQCNRLQKHQESQTGLAARAAYIVRINSMEKDAKAGILR